MENDPWPWGGEPIYRDGVYCGMTTSTSYGFTLNKHVCLGYVHNYNADTKQMEVINNSYITNKYAKFEVDIAGKRFLAKANLFAPSLKPVNALARV